MLDDDWQEPVAPLFGGPCWNQSYYHSKCGNIKIRAKDSKSNPLLFADDIWPGALFLADFLADNCDVYCKEKCVLELGAGGALPSLVCAKLGCRRLVISDYPDEAILNNIVDLLTENELDTEENRVFVRGHRWGECVDNLLFSNIPSSSVVTDVHSSDGCDAHDDDTHSTTDDIHNHTNRIDYFDTIILAELLWKDTYTQHRSLLQSVVRCLRPFTGKALVCFAHRPVVGIHTPSNDLEFFEMARSNEFELDVHLIGSKELPDPFAGEDCGAVTVFLYEMVSGGK
jgi:predicted nicotinamide N-methyase